MAIVAPSILAADLARVEEEAKAAQQAGADWIHVDVMDGRFVPPITFGDNMVRALKRVVTLPLDVHLMIVEPEKHLQAFADAGAARITVHVEACQHIHRTVQRIRELGVKAGVAINPGTPLGMIEPVLRDVDLVLVMTVNPGWGGQTYIETSDARIAVARQLIKQSGQTAELEVDGGINAATAKRATVHGATVLVAGTAIFGSKDYRASIEALRNA